MPEAFGESGNFLGWGVHGDCLAQDIDDFRGSVRRNAGASRRFFFALPATSNYQPRTAGLQQRTEADLSQCGARVRSIQSRGLQIGKTAPSPRTPGPRGRQLARECGLTTVELPWILRLTAPLRLGIVSIGALATYLALC